MALRFPTHFEATQTGAASEAVLVNVLSVLASVTVVAWILMASDVDLTSLTTVLRIL